MLSRPTCVFITIFVLISPVLLAQEFWYQAYNSAMKAIQKKDWELAEKKLKIALSQQSKKQGKDVDTYGFGNRIDYYPDYYLGVVYFEQKRYEEANRQFEKAEKLNLLKDDVKLYENLMQYKQSLAGRLPVFPPPAPPAPPLVRISIIFSRQVQKPFQVSNHYEFGCEERKTATVSFQLPPRARLISASSAWKKIINTDFSTTTDPVVQGNVVVARGEIGGLSRILCTGSGNGELELSGEYAIDLVVDSNPKIIEILLGQEVALEELLNQSDISGLLIGVSFPTNPSQVSKIEIPVNTEKTSISQIVQKPSVDERYMATLKGNLLTIRLMQH